MNIVFAGGGTGGHISPLIAVFQEINSKLSGKLTGYYLGPKDEFSRLLEKEGVIVRKIFSGKIRRYFTPLSFLENIFDILIKTPLGLAQSFFCLLFISPDLVFSKGGFGSVPVVIAAWFLRIPVFLHESDAVSGFANRFLSRLAKEIFISFPIKETASLPPHKLISVGCPIRPEIFKGSLESAKKVFSLSGERPVVLVLGGSQGSQAINDTILLALEEMLIDVEIIHQTGSKNFKAVKKESEVITTAEARKYYHPAPFLEVSDLADAYAASDLVVSRAGAATIFELAALAKPSILIPLSGSAQSHQLKNAYTYAKWQAAVVVEENNLSPHFLIGKIKHLFFSPGELKFLSNGAKNFSRPQAARIIAEYLIAYLNK